MLHCAEEGGGSGSCLREENNKTKWGGFINQRVEKHVSNK